MSSDSPSQEWITRMADKEDQCQEIAAGGLAADIGLYAAKKCAWCLQPTINNRNVCDCCCRKAGIDPGKSEPQQYPLAGVDVIKLVMDAGAEKHGTNTWQTQSPYDDLLYAIAHLQRLSCSIVGRTRMDLLSHQQREDLENGVTRAMMLLHKLMQGKSIES